MLAFPVVNSQKVKDKTFASCCSGEGRSGRCSGDAYCTACTSCRYCAHCNSCGTCGVCSSYSAPVPKAKRRTVKKAKVVTVTNIYNQAPYSSSAANQTHFEDEELFVNQVKLNLRETPSTKSRILEELHFMDKVYTGR